MPTFSWIDRRGRTCRTDHRRLLLAAYESAIRPVDLLRIRIQRSPLFWVTA